MEIKQLIKDKTTAVKNYWQSDEYFKISNKHSHILLIITSLFVFIMLIWANFAILDEVTVAEGKVIPSQKTQVIDNFEGGIVKELLVKEGNIVQKDQILVRLDNTRFYSAYGEEKIKEMAFRLKWMRLQAEVNDQPFKVDDQTAQTYPNLVKNEEELYNSRKNERQMLNDKRNLIIQQINMTKPLLKTGAVAPIEILQLQQALREIGGSISKFQSDTLQQLNDAEAQASQLQKSNLSLADQLKRTEIRSPVHGIVKQIFNTTVGGVVKPGTAIMEIVPLDDTLLIEARVKPRDVGFLHLNQDAMIKVSAYDFSIYGGLKGIVEHISADTSVDEKGNSYYEIWVRTQKNYLEKGGKKMDIIPGMQVSVDILTGQKSVLTYLLKPIMKAKQQALRER